MEEYRTALARLCSVLRLKGRILVGCSDKAEGINGTLAGMLNGVRMFTYALLGKDYLESQNHIIIDLDEQATFILNTFWGDCKAFADKAGVPVLTMRSPDDFKWSKCKEQTLFPDLNIKLVKEVIGTGGVFSSIEVEDTSQGYLTPEQWHEELQVMDSKETILIDCRNTKEFQIGHFPNAIDPNTTTFAQFPNWVQQNAGKLAHKKVLMYCTGGIRCEKASQYIRGQVDGVQSVQHLKGGIHKYLELYGSDGLWKGKNFVFDGRGATSGAETKSGKDASNGDETIEESDVNNVVGKCLYCKFPYDTFHPSCVCTVCREPTLVCNVCRPSTPEYHCKNHFHLKSCYFLNLDHYEKEELEKQLCELEVLADNIAVGKRYKQKRKTLQKQIDKLRDRLDVTALEITNNFKHTANNCRNCGESECSGECWGFHGLKRKELLEKVKVKNDPPSVKKSRQSRLNSNKRSSKLNQKGRFIEEVITLGLSQPPAMYRDEVSGIRVPPPCTRLLQTLVKGKWCGKTAKQVVLEEFPDLARGLSIVTEKGLLKVNGHTDLDLKLKNMDEISRIVHWHEPPVIVPEIIQVQRIGLEKAVIDEYSLVASEHDTLEVFACNKPSSVPVHPAGPYLSNSLTMMVEAQEGLKPRALIPCHRIDRATSGLTICCTNVCIARILQTSIDEGRVRKLYMARVIGLFPSTTAECIGFKNIEFHKLASIDFLEDCLEINAPVLTNDPSTGIRIVSKIGKPSKSRFRFLDYDHKSNTSLILCYPMTGRGHQLRLHLQFLGYPIVDDVQYGGFSESTSNMKRSLELMCKPVSIKSKGTVSSDLVSPTEASFAIDICRCCKQGELGVTESFTKSQLLDSGHSISLHALKYEIAIPRKRKLKGCEVGPDNIAHLQLSIALPSWGSNIDVTRLNWLKER